MFDRIHTIWALLAGQRLRYAGALVSLIVASMLLYAVPIVPQVVLDGVLTDEVREGSLPERVGLWLLGGRDFLGEHLWVAALAVIGLTLLAAAATYLRGRWVAIAAESVVCRLRDRLHHHLNHLPCTWYDEAETGDVLQRCTSDVDTLRNFLAMQVIEIGRALAMLLIPLPIMFMMDTGMAVASIVLLPFIIAWALFFYGRVKTIFRDKDEAEGRLTACVNENLTGIRVVRAFARQDFERAKFHDRNDEHRRLDYRLYAILAWFWSASDQLCFIQKALVFILGGYWVAVGSLEIGTYYFFIAAVSMYVWPVRMMGRLLAELGKAIVAVDRIHEILETPEETATGTQAPPHVAHPGHIEFEAITFSHGSTPVVHGIDLSIDAGRTLAIVGPSGSGKSTLINLLLRLYEPDAGRIRVDGVDITDLDRQAHRRRMAVVMQDPFLYSRSIHDNIALSRRTASDDEVQLATRVACIHDSILEFDEGYETLVGERGVTLSGGQRQRVAIARALLQQPEILVLDDALSAVDTRTERMILEAMRDRHGRQTTIVIAHRLSTLTAADDIIVLDEGRIVQQGTHASLASEPGMYRRLWEIQTTIESTEEGAA
ncbi:MAG: ABC transporter ATP-binding protein [Phycisphaerales bacterium]|nr:ABC transporter ATP-binding protein [Phycisphaerales bacterium]